MTATPGEQATVPAPGAARAGALVLDILPGFGLATTALIVTLSMSPHSAWWLICDNQNDVLVQLAESELITCTVLVRASRGGMTTAAVDVRVVTKFTSKSADGKAVAERETVGL